LREAFPFDQAPEYLLRDRDGIFGDGFSSQVKDLGIKEVVGAPRSPWQRAYVGRLIGTIRRECLNHVIFSTRALYTGTSSLSSRTYHESRTRDCQGAER
jgi:hypothetical protein